MLSGYREDGEKTDEDLTELTIDSLSFQVDDIDSLGQLYKRDSVVMKKIYHNDRTTEQSRALITYLVSQGLPASRFTYFVNAIEATLPQHKKLTIKAVARAK